MPAGRVWFVLSAAFLAGCTARPEQPASTAPLAVADAGADAVSDAVADEDVLAGIVTAAPPETPESLAEKRAQLEANLKLAQQSADRGDADQAIALLEDAVMLDARHRTVLLSLTRLLHQRSLAVVEEDPRVRLRPDAPIRRVPAHAARGPPRLFARRANAICHRAL